MYLNQKGIAQQKLAEIFLSCGIGERIPTFTDLQKELKVGIGTIQTAIKELEMNGIIQLQAQQRYGTILTGKSTKELWKFLSKRYVVGLFPEPLSLEMRGLAMGLREVMDDLDIPLVIVYGYGSKVRFDRIVNRPTREDFVISSLESARHRQKADEALAVSLRFGANSFYAADSLVILDNIRSEDRETRKNIVGIDYNSYDHMLLTQAAFPDADYVNVRYGEIPFESLSGKMDTVVWHQTTPVHFPEDMIKARKFESVIPDFDIDSICEAVLSINRNNRLMTGIMESIDVEKVIDIQKKVLNRELEPIF